MPHRIEAAGLPRAGRVEEIRPRLAERDGVRVRGVCVHGDALLFRAQGAVPPGLWREPRGLGEATLVLADRGAARLLDPFAAGPWAAAHEAGGGAPSSVRRIHFARAGDAAWSVVGQSCGVSADGRVAVVFDREARCLRRLDLIRGVETNTVDVIAGLDAQLAPLIGVDHDGQRALLLDGAHERTRASLYDIDLASGARQTRLGPLPGPGWISAVFVPPAPTSASSGAGEPATAATVVAFEMRLGDAPRFRVLRLEVDAAPSVLAELALEQPASLPALLPERAILAPLSIEAHALATYGPSDLAMLPWHGGAVLPITRRGDVQGRARVDGDVVWVEGGDVALRVPLV